jgi:NADPH-dependent curcumin reductase CurA
MSTRVSVCRNCSAGEGRFQAYSGLVKIDLGMGTLMAHVLGMPGMTGYFNRWTSGQPKAGETVVVSGAAGAVGQTDKWPSSRAAA